MSQSELYTALLNSFEESAWTFVQVEGQEVIRAGFEAHHTRVELHVQVFAPLTAISVVSESPLTTNDPVKRERLAELVMRVNEKLTVGSFEMSWDTSRVIYRATNLFPDPGGDPSIIRGLVQNTVTEMDRMAPLISLIHRHEGPELLGLDLRALIEREDLIPDPENEGP